MRIHLSHLRMNNRESTELIEFSPQISFLHGPVSVGKSTIARLIDYCLGGDLERTPALRSEFLSAQLTAEVGAYTVTFEREAHQAGSVRVTWEGNNGVQGSIMAPIQAGREPILDDEVFGLSDLIFYLVGTTPIKVRRSKRDPDSPLVRLSFRDVLWYCYLKQDHLDSSFFRMEDTFVRYKSIDVIRFIVGLHSERLSELEGQLLAAQDAMRGNRAAVQQIRAFLRRFQLGTDVDIVAQLGALQSELDELDARRARIEEDHASTTHEVDPLRERLRALVRRLQDEETAIADLAERINLQESLRSELIGAKVKADRAQEGAEILEGVSFQVCPQCGTSLPQERLQSDGVCLLCGQAGGRNNAGGLDPEHVRTDLNSRIDDLSESIKRHQQEEAEQKERLIALRREKEEFDRQLNLEIDRYDSAYVSEARAIDRQIAQLEERKASLERLSGMPRAIHEMEQESGRLQADIETCKASMADERNRLSRAQRMIEQIEDTFLSMLQAIEFPGVDEDDRVEINRRSFRPFVVHGQDVAWDFFQAGSGGKKVLFNVCYALAIHKVASVNDLPLPRFLMIDSPMKNISRDVNPELVRNFYRLLYSVAANELSDTQFILIDSDLVPPVDEQVEFTSRLITTDDPLISYYRGP